MYAAQATEALQLLSKFQFTAAVLAWRAGADVVAAALRERRVRFFLYGIPALGAVPVGNALIVADMVAVVPILVT